MDAEVSLFAADINDLISKGMLCDSGEGGRSANYILPDIASAITLG